MGKINDMSKTDIMDKVKELLPIRDYEKKKFGEVFTPPELINEMLDKLPKSVWGNKDLKWLDPANGAGNFPMVAYTKLMEGLKTKIPNEQKRKDHIIKNMLYMVELNPKNVAKSRKIFGNDANIVCANALKTNWLDKFKKNQGFDVIMGNPPYNSGSTGRSGTSGVDNKFINTFLDFLNKGGYMVFVTKTGWRSRFGGASSREDLSSIHKKLENMTLKYSKVFDFNENPFSQNVLTNFFVIQNKKNSNYETTFCFNNTETKGHVIKNMNIYFLNRKYLTYLKELKDKYGNLKEITRGVPRSSNYLLLSHRTEDVITKRPRGSAKDKFYVIENPNNIMKFFFKSKLYADMRNIGRFTGFATSKALFYDIPDFNKIPTKNREKILKKLKSFENKIRKLPTDAKTRKRSKRKRRNNITRRLKRRQGGGKTRKRSKIKRRHKITRNIR